MSFWDDINPVNVVNNTVHTVNNTTNAAVAAVGGNKTTVGQLLGTMNPVTQIPASVNDATSQIQASSRDAENAATQSSIDYSNFYRSDPGQYLKGFETGNRELVTAIPDAIVTGNWGEDLQKWAGSLRTVLSGGFEGYAGDNAWIQKNLNDPNLNKNTLGISGQFADQEHGGVTMRDSGYLSNHDRNGWVHLFTEVAAVVAAIFTFGGSAAAEGAGEAGAGEAGAGAGAEAGAGAGAEAGAGAGAGVGAGEGVSTTGTIIGGDTVGEGGDIIVNSGDAGSAVSTVGTDLGGDTVPTLSETVDPVSETVSPTSDIIGAGTASPTALAGNAPGAANTGFWGSAGAAAGAGVVSNLARLLIPTAGASPSGLSINLPRSAPGASAPAPTGANGVPSLTPTAQSGGLLSSPETIPAILAVGLIAFMLMRKGK